MIFSVDFPTEIEKALERQAAASGVDVPTFVRQLVTERVAIGEQRDVDDASRKQTGSQFAERLKRWIDLHPTGVSIVDDSRESIYRGREE